MANANNNQNNVGIRNSYSLLAFAKSHGKMQVGKFVNKETGEEFSSCIFTNPEDQSRCFVSFSQNLGELSAREIADRKDSLQVVELETGNFKLCNVGANNWQDVDLF